MARRFSFVLPADWWRIPLVSEEARDANIAHLVNHQVPPIDAAAQLRHELTDELTKQAGLAAQAGGLVMAFYLLTLEDAPISATMTCYDVSGLLGLPGEIDPAKLLAHYVGDSELEASLPELSEMLFPDGVPDPAAAGDGNAVPNPFAAYQMATPGSPDQGDPVQGNDTSTGAGAIQVSESRPGGTTGATGDRPAADADRPPWTKVQGYDILAYRREELTPGTDYFGPDVPRIEQLQVTYVQVVPDFGLVQTVFSTALTALRDAWVPMWDAMVATFRAGVGEPAESDTAK